MSDILKIKDAYLKKMVADNMGRMGFRKESAFIRAAIIEKVMAFEKGEKSN